MKEIKMKTKNYRIKKRISILIDIILTYGINIDDIIIISLNDMAYHINHTWCSKYFINKNVNIISQSFLTCYFNNNWAFKYYYDLSRLYRPIIKTLSFTNKIKLKSNKALKDFLIIKNET